MNVLSLCAGVGGLDLGVELATGGVARTVCYVEREAHAAAVLVARMEEALLAPAAVWCDLTTFDGTEWRGVVDLVVAGYPCQPFSTAGKRAGVDDPRHLWPHVARIIRECGAGLVLLENVPAICPSDSTKSAATFKAWTTGLRRASSARRKSAQAISERLFILAHADGGQREQSGWTIEDEGGGERRVLGSDGIGSDMADAPNGDSRQQKTGNRREGIGRRIVEMADTDCDERPIHIRERESRQDDGTVSKTSAELAQAVRGGLGRTPEVRQESITGAHAEDSGPEHRGASNRDVFAAWPPGPNASWTGIPEHIWPSEAQSEVRGVADGMASRVDRLRACGNGVVPLAAAHAFRTLTAALAGCVKETT